MIVITMPATISNDLISDPPPIEQDRNGACKQIQRRFVHNPHAGSHRHRLLLPTPKDIFFSRIDDDQSTPKIFNASQSERKHGADDQVFNGACVDTGAQVSVCGKRQARAYCRRYNIPFDLKPSGMAFKFGDHVEHSLGTMRFRIPSPTLGHLEFTIDVVNLDVPLLLGLRELKQEQLLVNNLKDEITSMRYGWTTPLELKDGHLYWQWKINESYYTKPEIERLHQHFFHPSARKLYNLLRRSKTGQLNPGLHAMIEQVTDACRSCQEFSSKPFRFRASMPDESVVYNHELAIDLLWLDKKPVLHVVDTHTCFQNAIAVEDKTAEGLWDAFVRCWSTVYLGFPNVLRLDQEASFNSRKFQTLAEAHGMTLQYSGVESHNAIGVGERFHAPLRRVYELVRSNHPQLSEAQALRYAIKGVNDTANTDGLVPSLLVFGVLPTYPLSNRKLPGQVQRLQAMADARAEMGNIVAEQRITRALRAKLPPAVRYDINAGDPVLVYREDKRRWLGPYKVERIDDKRAFITDGKFSRPFSLNQIMPFSAKQRDLELKRLLHGLKDLRSCPQIGITEVFYPSDEKAKNPKCFEAIAKEIKGLLERGVFKIMNKRDLPENSNIIGSRMVLAVKDIGTATEKFKARLVIHGHKDREKDKLSHNSPAIRQPSLRLMMTTAAIRRYKIWSLDITQAFIQSNNITRPVYLRPPIEFGLKQDEVFKLVKPLYGLSDAGDYWYATLRTFIREELGLPNSDSDVSLYISKAIDDICNGLMSVYVDDLCAAGDEEFGELMKKIEDRFDSRERIKDEFHFAGIKIKQHNDGKITIDQEPHALRIQQLDEDCTYEQFRSRRHALAWLSASRPDICATANIMSQITAKTFSKDNVKTLNKVLAHVQDTPSQGLTFHPLDENTIRIVVFSDSSFANLDDKATQLGYVVLMTDDTGRANLLNFASYKSKRIVRSVLGGETHAFADGFDMAYTLKKDMEKIFNKELQLTMLTDSMSLFRVMLNSSVTTEKRLLIDIAAAREAYERKDIDFIGWIPTENNISNGLTKLGLCPTLISFLKTTTLSVEIRTVINRRYETVPLGSETNWSTDKKEGECATLIQQHETTEIKTNNVNYMQCNSITLISRGDIILPE